MSYSAGIMPYVIRDDRIHVLLGNDKKYNKWSDFGGKSMASDKGDKRLTAARECFEESCGVLEGISNLHSMIRDSRMITCNSYSNKTYYMYLLNIDKWKHDPTQTFERQMEMMTTGSVTHHAKFLEKTALQWFLLEDILSKKELFRSAFYKSILHNYKNILGCVSI